MKLSSIILNEENRYNDDGYDKGDIKLMGDMILPTDKPYPIGIEIDGKEVAKDAKIVKFLFHPEMK